MRTYDRGRPGGSRSLKQRVVITGLGVVACCGVNLEAFWRAVREGKSGIGYIQRFDVSGLPSKIGGEVRDFDPLDYIDEKKAKKQGRFVHFALAAAKMAIQDSGLDLSQMNPYHVGVAFGSSSGGYGNIADEGYRIAIERGVRYVPPTTLNEISTHAGTVHIAIEFGLKGPCASNSTGCASGITAIEDAMFVLRSGGAECMVVGASDACLSPLVFQALCKQKVLSRHNDDPAGACKPFDLHRDGLVLGEGGGVMVLETAEHALERGAHIYAEVLAASSYCEARHLLVSGTTGEEMAVALKAALASGRVGPSDVDYVCIHGIGNKEYDLSDTRGLKLALGRHAYNVPASSIKPVTGQPFGGAVPMQVAAVCKAFEEDILPPTINLTTPDPECDLDYVPGVARRARINVATINSHSFGGTHAVVLLRRFDAEES